MAAFCYAAGNTPKLKVGTAEKNFCTPKNKWESTTNKWEPPTNKWESP